MRLYRSMKNSPYWPVIGHPLLRRILPGVATSFLGDGMALVAVVLLAQRLTTNPTLAGMAVAAYTLPGAVGAVVLGKVLSGRSGAQLAGWDAVLRGVALAAIPLAAALGALTIGLYIGLLAISAVLHSWGTAGRYTLLAEILPVEQHLAGNAVMSTLSEIGTIGGPVLAGLVITWHGPIWVIAVDAVTFGLLALTYRFAAPATLRAATTPPPVSRTAGFSFIARNRSLTGLLALSFGFFFLFGPVYVALPTLLEQVHGTGSYLAVYYTAFGIGAVAGGAVTGHLRRWSLWATTLGVVIAYATVTLPLGLTTNLVVTVASFAVGGLAWAPYLATSMSLYQRVVPAARLPQVLAANAAVSTVAGPLGTALGGPLIALVGARTTLLLSSTAILAIGLLGALVFAMNHHGSGAVPRAQLREETGR